MLNPSHGFVHVEKSSRHRSIGKVNLRYVQTTVKEDLQYFYTYGIRGLPSLLLADAAGKEIKRLPPGVNPLEKVRELLLEIPK